MPDATITSTASTFGTISGTFAADQSTITGTVTGVVVGTLDGSVGVPGIGVPDGGTTGQVLKKASNTSYDTVWGTDLNAPAWGTITGTLSSQTDLNTALGLKYDASNPSGFITSAALSPYLTSATAASTYQTIAGMSSYLTTSAAASTYQTQAGMSSYLTTATAASTYAPLASPTFTGTVTIPAGASISGYLTSATAASTYQTLSGMSSYLTTSAAASTYAPLASPTFTGTVTIPAGASISGYATTSSLSSYAPLASPALTGTPTSTTAAADTNTTQIATTAYVVGQASSTSPVMDGSATVGTSLKYARADHVHPTDTSLAPLASPALTGTPTAPTAAAGTNTTQIATTAFVTSAVPSFASVAQSRSATSTTVSQNPSTNLWQTMNPGLIYIANAGLGYTATGTMGGQAQGYFGCRITMGTAGAASANWRYSGASFDAGYICLSKSYRSYIDFSRYIRISGRFYTEDNWADPQLTGAVYFGKAANSANGDLARAGFGWKVSGNATAGNRKPVLQVHNGTTLTNVTGSFAMVAQQYFDWDIISDGTGNVTLYINGTQQATTSAGPTADTSYSGTTPMIWSCELISTGTTAAYNATFGRGCIYIAQ